MTSNALNRCFFLTSVASLALLTGSCSTSVFKAESGQKPEMAAKMRSAKALIRMGDATWRGGDPASSARFYQAAVNAAPKDPIPAYKLARALQAIGAHNAAADTYRKLLILRPGNPEAKRQLANTLISLDNPTAAIALYQEVIAENGDYRAFNGLGVALDMTGKHKDALAAYRAGLAKQPRSLTLKNNLALSMALTGQYKHAAKVLRSVAADPKATARHRQNLALVYGLSGKDHQAAKVARVDLDGPSVTRNLDYYNWLRRQPRWMVKKMLRKGAPVKPQAASSKVRSGAKVPRKASKLAPRRSNTKPRRQPSRRDQTAHNIKLENPERALPIRFARLEFGFRPAREAEKPATAKNAAAQGGTEEIRAAARMPVVVRGGVPKPAKTKPAAKPVAAPATHSNVIEVATPKVIRVSVAKAQASPASQAAAAVAPVSTPKSGDAKVVRATVARVAEKVTRKVEVHFMRAGLEHLIGKTQKVAQTASN